MEWTKNQYLLVAFSTFVIYSFLILLFRIIGRRSLGQLSSLDLLVLILLGSAVETSMVHASTSIKVGMVSALTLLVANRLLTKLMLGSRKLRHMVGAGPVLVIHHGRYVEEHLRRLGLTKQDLDEALRQRECGSVGEVRFAVLEPDGELNVVLEAQAVTSA